MVLERLKYFVIALVSLVLFAAACSDDEDPGAGEGEACDVDADCAQGLLCRGQVCIASTNQNNTNNPTDAGNANNSDGGGEVVEGEDFRVSYKLAALDQTEELRILNTETGEEQTVSPAGLDCRFGCWLTEDTSTFLYLRTNTENPGSFDLYTAPTTTLPIETCSPETDCLEAVAVRNVEVSGNLVTYVRQEGQQNVAYYKRVNSTDPEIAIGSLGAIDSTLGDWFIAPDADKVAVYQPTLQTLDVLVGDLGELQDSVDFTVDAQNYQEVSGSYFGGQTLTAINDEGTRMAFVTQRAPLDGDACTNDSECLAPGARCGRFDRCAFIQVTMHFVDLESVDNLGESCSSNEACGPVHTCDIPDETQLNEAVCIPRRVVLGLPGEQQQGTPPQSGCALTTGNEDLFFTEVLGPVSFGADGDAYVTAVRSCDEGNIPYSAVIAVDPISGDIRDVVGNRSENFFAQDCYNPDEDVATPSSCNFYVSSALVGPEGNKIALTATNPTLSDPNLATRFVDLWTINRDGTELEWIGQHTDINPVRELKMHPLP